MQIFVKLHHGEKIALDVEQTDKVSEVAKKIFRFRNGCELSLMSMKENETLNEKILTKARSQNRPILIKSDGKFSIYGYREGDWRRTELDNLPKPEQDILDKLPSFYFKAEVYFPKWDNPLLLETLKRGHTFQVSFGKWSCPLKPNRVN